MVVAVVEIGGDPVWLLVAGTFVVVMVAVCAAAWWLLSRTSIDRGHAKLDVDIGTRLPVSKPVFDRLTSGVAAGIAKPVPTPERLAFTRGLEAARRPLLSFYRTTLCAVGLAGIAFALILFRDATPANMQALPAGIVLLLSLGALLEGLFPRRARSWGEPIDPQLLEKIGVRVTSPASLTIALSEDDMRRAADMLRQGASLAEVAGAVCRGYDGLDSSAQAAIRDMLQRALDRR
jgi:hypothetical protein